ARAVPGFAPLAGRGASVARALDLIAREAGDGPLIVVFEDLHFADEGTVAVVARVIGVCAGRPWLGLATFRPAEGPPGPLAPLAEPAGQDLAERLDLAPLSRAAVATIAAGAGDGYCSDEAVDRLWRESGGNPWLVQALARGDGALAM